MGWDKHYGFQLYQSDPSGNYGGWKATCIGNNHSVCCAIDWICTFLFICLISQAAVSMLKQDYKEDCSLKEALALAVKVMSKSLDSTKMAPDKGIDIVPFFCLVSIDF